MSVGVACLIISLVFVVFLVVGFFTGFWRGLKKSSLNLALSSASLLLAFFFTSMITGAILNINISTSSGPQTINNYLVSLLTSDASITQLITNVPSLKTIVYALPHALANVVVFLVLVMLFEFVFYIIYKIISAIFFGKDKKKESYKPHRVWGGVVGTVKTLLIIMFAFMPITALARTANDVLADPPSYTIEAKTAQPQNDNILNKVPKEAKTWIKAYTNSPFGFVGGVFGQDTAMFDYLTKVEFDDQPLYIRKEIPAAFDTYNIYTQISSAAKNGMLDYSKLDFEKLDEVYGELTDGGLFSVVSDFLASYMENYKSFDLIDYTKFGELTEIFDSVANSLKTYQGGAKAFFKNDIDKLYQSFKELSISGTLNNVSFTNTSVFDIIKTLTSDYLASTQIVVKNLFDMNMIRSSIAPIADKAISLIIKDAEKVVVDTSRWTQEKWEQLSNQLLTISSKLHLVVDEIDFETLLSNPMELLSAEKQYNVDNIFGGIGAIVDELREIEIFKNSNGQPVIDKLLSDAGFALPTAPVFDNAGNAKTISNYKELFNFMQEPFKELKALDIFATLSNSSASQTEIFNLLAEVCKTNPNALSNIILPLQQIEPTKTLLVDNVLGSLSNEIIDFTTLNSYEDWKNDLSQISNLLVTLSNGKIGEQTYLEYILGGNSTQDLILNLGENKLSEILTPMLRAKSTKGMTDSIFNICSDAINSILNHGTAIAINSNVTFEEGNENDQTAEVCDIFDKFVPIYKEYNSGKTSLEELNRLSLGDLLDALKLNRYRGDYDANKTEDGAFGEMFDAIMGEIETKYGKYISFKPEGESDYRNTDFAAIMKELDDIISKLPIV